MRGLFPLKGSVALRGFSLRGCWEVLGFPVSGGKEFQNCLHRPDQPSVLSKDHHWEETLRPGQLTLRNMQLVSVADHVLLCFPNCPSQKVKVQQSTPIATFTIILLLSTGASAFLFPCPAPLISLSLSLSLSFPQPLLASTSKFGKTALPNTTPTIEFHF